MLTLACEEDDNNDKDDQPVAVQGFLDMQKGLALKSNRQMEPYLEDKKKFRHNPESSLRKTEMWPCSWAKGRWFEVATKLFVHQTNFDATHHGWHTGSNLVPSAYLDIAVSKEQDKLLNPDPCDAQIGVIVDQCRGKKAMK